jgi:hypothetical protein
MSYAVIFFVSPVSNSRNRAVKWRLHRCFCELVTTSKERNIPKNFIRSRLLITMTSTGTYKEGVALRGFQIAFPDKFLGACSNNEITYILFLKSIYPFRKIKICMLIAFNPVFPFHIVQLHPLIQISRKTNKIT